MRGSAIHGSCIACGSFGSLFVASGGHITCDVRECPDPGAVADLLSRPRYHVLDVQVPGWGLQHPPTCFPDLLACEVHDAVDATALPWPLGRWRIDGPGARPVKIEDGRLASLDREATP